MTTLRWPIVIAALSLATHVAIAEPSTKRLGGDLTPTGATRAGNAEGTIPPWRGGIGAPPARFKKGGHYADPFAADKPILTIDAKNSEQFADKLTDAHAALFEAYPDTYRMIVYPTRRSCSLPKRAYTWIRRNAVSAELVEDGNGVIGAYFATPFPIPENATQILWNHLLRYRGHSLASDYHAVIVHKDGSGLSFDVRDSTRWPWSDPDLKELPPGSNLYALSKSSFEWLHRDGNVRIATGGRGDLLAYQTLRPALEPRILWYYTPETRRTARRPDLQYDKPNPLSHGLTTIDSDDGFNGVPDRYEWKLVGRSEAYIPYNSYALHDPTLDEDSVTTPRHLNPEAIRYELHRVWVIEGALRAGFEHRFPKRRFYVDEDSWSIVAATLYDADGRPAQVQEAFTINAYDLPACVSTANVSIDLSSERYFVRGLSRRTPPNRFRANDFTPEGLHQGMPPG